MRSHRARRFQRYPDWLTADVRDPCAVKCRSYPTRAQHPPRRSQTCFEGPFGEVIRATGPMAKVNPIRWSTKYEDDETDFVYYGHRFVRTLTGGWLSRDSLAEKGGLNLYGFVHNDPQTKYDALGKFPSTSHNYEFDGGGTITVGADISAWPPCSGGPLFIVVDFNYTDTDMGWFKTHGVHFTFDGIESPPEGFVGYPEMSWANSFTISLPICPKGTQTGSTEFSVSYSAVPNVMGITFHWSYSCDCNCHEKEPFTTSMDFHIKTPPITDRHRRTGPL